MGWPSPGHGAHRKAPGTAAEHVVSAARRASAYRGNPPVRAESGPLSRCRDATHERDASAPIRKGPREPAGDEPAGRARGPPGAAQGLAAGQRSARRADPVRDLEPGDPAVRIGPARTGAGRAERQGRGTADGPGTTAD